MEELGLNKVVGRYVKHADNMWTRLRNLNRPIMAMAPLANVTDASFRRLVAKYGKPDVMFTEFVSAIKIANETQIDLDLVYDESERPIVAQIFGSNPDDIYKAVKRIRSLGFDGVDINMGCPDKLIMKQGCGSGLIRNPELAQKIIAAARRAANEKESGDEPRPFGVSVKTRIGDREESLDTWLPCLLEMEPDAITLHLRTRKEMSNVPAHWTEEVAGKASRLVKEVYGGKTLILGNGDIRNVEEGIEKCNRFNLDGIIVGRGMMGNPYFFSKKNATIQDKVRALMEHNRLYVELMSARKSMDYMRRHYKAYVKDFEGCKEIRQRMYDAKTIEEFEKIAQEVIEKQVAADSSN